MTLHSPATAIGYHLWLRSRWPLIGSIAGMVALYLIAGLLPQELRASLLPPALMIFSTLLVILMSVFTYAGGDLSARESGFPRYMFTLPVQASTLVVTPMIYGGLTSALMWVLLVRVGLARLGPGAPVLWPAAASTAVCVWLQAISWVPVWFRTARVLAGVVILTAVIAVGISGQFFGIPPLLLLAGYLAIIATAFLTAIAGLARARRGDGIIAPWESSQSSRAPANRHPLAPFSSAWRASIWWECRRNLGFSILLCALMPLSIVMVMEFANPDHRTGIYVQGHTIHPAMLALGICLAMPLFSAIFLNGMIAKPDAWLPSLELPAFHAARPVSTPYLLGIKLMAAAIGVFASWGITLLIVGVWIFLPHSFDRNHTIAQMAAGLVTPRRIWLALAILAALIFSSWKIVVESLFTYVYGRKWLLNVIVFVSLGIWGSIPTAGYWLGTHERWLKIAIHLLPWVAAAIVILRVAAFTWILRSLSRHQIISITRGLIFAAAWLLLAIGIWLSLFASVPLVRPHAWGLAFAVFLSLPLVRISLAPLMLHFNRHR